MPDFKVHSPYEPSGDQPQAIEKLASGVEAGLDEQVQIDRVSQPFQTIHGHQYPLIKLQERFRTRR